MKAGWFSLIIALIVLVLILIPKDIQKDSHDSTSFCSCIGVGFHGSCLGFTYGCIDIKKAMHEADIQNKESQDILLVLDVSADITDKSLELTRKAALDLVDNLKDDDRLGIISFAGSAKVLCSLTDNKTLAKDTIRKLKRSYDKNRVFLPALHLTRDVFYQTDGSFRKAIFLSRKSPDDNYRQNMLYRAVEQIADDKICLYTIGYSGRSGGASVLENMADMSEKIQGCGSYFYTDEEDTALSEIFRYIYDDRSSDDLSINILEPKAKKYNSDSIRAKISTDQDSLCAYSLNGLNKRRIYDNRFSFKAEKGKNTLEVSCKKKWENSSVTIKEQEFFAEKENLFKNIVRGYLKRYFVKHTEISAPERDEQTSILSKIYNYKRPDIRRESIPSSRGTLINIRVRNDKPIRIHNLRIIQTFPEDMIKDLSSIRSETDFNILSQKPYAAEFLAGDLDPEETAIVSYYVSTRIREEDLDHVRTKILFDPPYEEDMEDLLMIADRTTDELEITNAVSGRKGEVLIRPKHDLSEVYLYFSLPGCLSENLNRTSLEGWKIVPDKNIIAGYFEKIKDDIEIEYDLTEKASDACIDNLQVIAIAGDIGSEIMMIRTSGFTSTVILFIILIPALLAYGFMTRRQYTITIMLIRYIALAIILSGLIWSAYPKTKTTKNMSCSCIGISDQDTCFGMPISCQRIQNDISGKKMIRHDTCASYDCETLSRYMRTDPERMEEHGIDLTLLLDQSRSMEDGKMEKAKDASISMLDLIDKKDRISVISFDNSSKLIQEFSNDKILLRKSIRNIELGFRTEYIPALDMAYYNYLAKGNKYNRWLIIFLSDGEPSDDDDVIFAKVKQMTSEGICIHTIGYGDESGKGSEAERILKRIAQISNQTTGCGTYHYSPKSFDKLRQILGKVYMDASDEATYIQLNTTLNSLHINEKEYLTVKATARSSTNNLNIPGSFRKEDKRYCAPVPEMNFNMIKSNNKTSYPMRFDWRTNTYDLDISHLAPGSYNTSVTSEIRTKDGCSYHGKKDTGLLTIDEYKGFDECVAYDCSQVAKYLFSDRQKMIIDVLITDYAFIPQNVSVGNGTTIIWRNVGKKPHTVTSGMNHYDGRFHSGIIQPGQSFNLTFTRGDRFLYFDNLSAKIKGMISETKEKDLKFGNFKLEYKIPIDLGIVIDRSDSMYGKKMDNLKMAAKSLVHMVYPSDRIGLVEFSDDAKVRQKFTYDRDIIETMIDRIHIGGSTRYVPALEKIDEMYDRRKGSEDHGKVVIFLSDGMPWDEDRPESILKTAGKLIDKGVCVFAVGYGEEVYPGSEAELLLKRIVNMSQSSTNCGDYKYSPADEIRLVKIFGSIYQEAAGRVDGLVIEADADKRIIFDNETIKLKVKVRSSYNDNYLPGIMNTTFGTFCGPPARVEAAIYDNGKKIYRTTLEYRGKSNGYTGEIVFQKKGDYQIEISAQTMCTDNHLCQITGETKIPVKVMASKELEVDYLVVTIYCMILALSILLLGIPFKKYDKRTSGTEK